MAAHTGRQDIARRYATAFFSLAESGGKTSQVEADMTALISVAETGEAFSLFADNATLTRAEQEAGILAIAKHLKLSEMTQRLLGTLAQKRRLPLLAAVAESVLALIAEKQGVVTAHVTAAQALDQSQVEAIAVNLKKSLNRDVRVNLAIDPEIIGGLVIRVGSKLIDSSVRTKLDRVHRAMKNASTTSDQKKMKEVA